MAREPKKGAHSLPRISEEMKQWSAMIGAELGDWPKVSSTPMFGMTAFYRGDQIFAVLPKTRGFQTPNGIAFRFEEIGEKLAKELAADRRVLGNPIGKKWITFQVESPQDVNAALEWLCRAYEAANKSSSPGAKRSRVSHSSRAKRRPQQSK